MGSSRLPGKTLMPLHGRPLVEWVVDRCRRSRLSSSVVLLTSTNQKDDALAYWARDFGVSCFRGDEQNVFGRFRGAVHAHPADHIVRVCCDNPMVCAFEIDRLVDFHLCGRFDYSFNHVPLLGSSYVDGFGAEVFRSDLMMAIHSNEITPSETEHVTKYFWNHRSKFYFGVVPAPAGLAHPEYSFDIDTDSDFQRFQKFTGPEMFNMTAVQVVSALKARGTLINFDLRHSRES
jgi:spore coat polysaccharide biosynthesis protein SpsF